MNLICCVCTFLDHQYVHSNNEHDIG